MPRYALIDPKDDSIVGVRSVEKPLADGTYNDKAAALVNGKPYLLPIQDAVIPPGRKVVSTDLRIAGNKVIETAVTEAVAPPAHAVDAALIIRPEFAALVREVAKLAGKTVAELVAAMKA
jgi:hypothetical protein